MNKNSGEWLNV